MKRYALNLAITYSSILHTWLSGYLDLLPTYNRNLVSPISTRKKVWKIAKSFLRCFLFAFRVSDIPRDRIWLFVSSTNNCNTLNFLLEIDGSVFVAPKLTMREEPFHTQCHILNYRKKVLYNLLFPIHFLALMLTQNGSKYRENFDMVFDAIGLQDESMRLIQRYRPKAIIFANDHSIANRALLLAAKEIGVKTIYIQHAAVSEYFPPLKFDLSLLEGQDSLDKYSNIGIEGRVELIGMPKIDPYLGSIRENSRFNSIGFCYNLTDSVESVFEAITEFRKIDPRMKIHVRPHPGDERNATFRSAQISDSKSEDAFSFLQKIDIVVSGDSSILLEAALLNIVPTYFKYAPGNMSDYYGFVKNGLAIKIEDMKELAQLVHKMKKEKPSILPRAKYYNSTVGTEFFGKSSKLALQKIVEFM